jgi:CRP/FNR family cyclic AMP-dependent transcriptional regulator
MENQIKFLHLCNQRIFTGSGEKQIQQLCIISDFKTLRKDSIIYKADQAIDRLYILIQGRIKIANSMGKEVEVVTEILKEEDIFGELTLKKCINKSKEFSQVLSDEAVICSFKLHDFENILHNNPAISITFSNMIADKLKIINGKYCDLVFKDVRARVLNFFMLHAQYEGKWMGNKAEINMFCTHQDIADFTASSRQTVSTVINNLVKEKKIIYEGRNKVIIPDVNNLAV